MHEQLIDRDPIIVLLCSTRLIVAVSGPFFWDRYIIWDLALFLRLCRPTSFDCSAGQSTLVYSLVSHFKGFLCHSIPIVTAADAVSLQ